MVAISGGTLAAIAAIACIDVFMVALLVGTSRRSRPAPDAPAVPPPPGPTRRTFLRRSLLASLGVFAAEFGGGTLAFLWPNLSGGFGSVFTVGKLDAIKQAIASTGEPFYLGDGRFYIVPYRGSGSDPSTGANYVDEGVLKQGVMPLYQRCVHLGCRVPFCKQSGWFECPCHGSKYNLAGEYELGPAPRGLDRFKITVDHSGNVIVDTSSVILGPPRGTNTIHEPAQGPFCVAA
jgi:cytochrome b6-f complex iron-sulfur subunit